jgi:two-component system sensor histidine kinase DegS
VPCASELSISRARVTEVPESMWLRFGFSNRPFEKIVNIHFWIILGIITSLSLTYYLFVFPYDKTLLLPDRYAIMEFRYHFNGALFIIPFVYAAIAFNWQGALIVWVISVALMLPRIIFLSLTPIHLATNLCYALLPLAVTMLVTFQIRWRQKERTILDRIEAERQVFTLEMLKNQEKDRQRLSRELHDDAVQALVLVAGRAKAILSQCIRQDNAVITEHADWIRVNTLRLMEDIRRMSLDLRPSVLDNLGLVRAIGWLVDNINTDHNMNTKLSVEGQLHRLTTEDEVAVFRIVQEALNNVRVHSQSTEASVRLICDSNRLRVIIQDNGMGFSISDSLTSYTSKGKLGLAGMQERAKLLNGTLDIQSSLGKGTTISLEVSHLAP